MEKKNIQQIVVPDENTEHSSVMSNRDEIHSALMKDNNWGVIVSPHR